MRYVYIRIAILSILGGSSLLAAGCGDGGARTGGAGDGPDGSTPRLDPAAAVVVGRTRCAECHPDESERWQGSHHDLAMQVAEPGAMLGDFNDVSFEHLGSITRFFRRGEEFWVGTEGPDGRAGEFPVAYAFGVDPLQQYLIELPEGRVQALDVAWDSRPEEVGGQRWFHLQPDERYAPGDPMHWTGVAYNWNHQCAECHSTEYRKNYDPVSGGYESVYAEIDVSCEACHGPGSVHVDWATAREESGGEVPQARPEGDTAGLQVVFSRMADVAWLIDPETGLAHRVPERETDAELATCARCHARRGVVNGDYRFGLPVTDFYRVSLLDRGLYHDDGQILDEVFVYGSFLQSRMHEQGVSCGDCHEPHSLRLHNRGNALCNRCHLADKFDSFEHHRHEVGTEGAACVSCHMPATTYMVVDPRRDHSFRVPRPDLSVRNATPNACSGCHTEEGAQWAADAVVEWFGPVRAASYVDLLADGRRAGVDAERNLRELASSSEFPAIARATAVAELSATSQAAIGVITRSLSDGDPLVRVGALRGLEGADPVTLMRLALPLVSDPDRSVRLEAARLIGTLPAQQIPPAQRSEVARALNEYRSAQEVSGDRAQAHLNLGLLALQQGDAATAEREYLVALRLEPYFIPTFVNLADLYRLTGREEEGERLLREALEIAPGSGDLHYAMGLLMVRQERLDDALEQLRLASELSPEQPHYVYVYAVGLNTAGEGAAALAALDGGLEVHPVDRELLFGGAAFSRDLGEIDRAVSYARRLVDVAPDDAQAAALLRELESMRR